MPIYYWHAREIFNAITSTDAIRQYARASALRYGTLRWPDATAFSFSLEAAVDIYCRLRDRKGASAPATTAMQQAPTDYAFAFTRAMPARRSPCRLAAWAAARRRSSPGRQHFPRRRRRTPRSRQPCGYDLHERRVRSSALIISNTAR